MVYFLDFGVKRNILRILSKKGCDLLVLNAQSSPDEILKLNPDGVFLSNGPGDPSACFYAIETIQNLSMKNLPIFGICLGHQLLALSFGAKTKKMKFGHHGANHPVKNLISNKVAITSQNHGFTVEDKNIPQILEVTHRSLFDGTIQGIKHKELPVYGFQFHPDSFLTTNGKKLIQKIISA